MTPSAELVGRIEAEPLHQAEAGPHRRREHAEARGGTDQREALQRHRDRLRVRPFGDPDVHPEVFHRRIEELLERGLEPVDLVDEQHVTGAERGQQTHQVAGLFQHRARGGAELHAHFPRHQHGQRRLAEAGRAEEERVVERLAALLGGVDRDLQRRLHLRLADELVQPRRAQRRVGAGLFGEGFGSGDLQSRHVQRASGVWAGIMVVFINRGTEATEAIPEPPTQNKQQKKKKK
jgi:hypothetical protein